MVEAREASYNGMVEWKKEVMMEDRRQGGSFSL